MPLGEGKYATTIVSRLLRDVVISRLEAGATVRSLRLPASEGGLRGLQIGSNEPFRFSNAALTELRREWQAIRQAKNLNNINFNQAVSQRNIIQSRMVFGSRYQYFGTAHIAKYTRVGGALQKETFQWPVNFGDNQRLTRIEIIERMEGIIETGNPGIRIKRLGESQSDEGADYQLVLEKITIDNVLESG